MMWKSINNKIDSQEKMTNNSKNVSSGFTLNNNVFDCM